MTLAEKLQELLYDLEELEQNIREAVEEVKVEAKREAMLRVQDLLIKGNSDEAKEMIDEIEELKNLTLSVNIRSIHEFVLTMLNMNSEQKRFTSNKSGNQFRYEAPKVKEDVKVIMKRKGYQFIEYVEGKLKFEKDGEYYFAIEVEGNTEPDKLEEALSDASKFCNLVLITESEYGKGQIKQKIENWINKTEDNRVLKKYLTIQLGSYEHLNQKGTLLERMNLS